jgi:hypothetical protein
VNSSDNARIPLIESYRVGGTTSATAEGTATVRLIRLGEDTASVGADLRAALASWGRGDGILGGIALIGTAEVQAVLVVHRGVIAVAAVDLPEPAMALEAPIDGSWQVDGWTLDGPNPADRAMAAAEALRDQLGALGLQDCFLGTVIAVGPYVSTVRQPSRDLDRGVRVLHPEPRNLLNAVRELAVRGPVRPAAEISAVLDTLAPGTAPEPAELRTEGFPTAALTAATEPEPDPDRALESEPEPLRDKATEDADPARRRRVGWLPVAAMGVVGLLLVAGILFAITSGGPESSAQPPPATTSPAGPQVVNAAGLRFVSQHDTHDTECAPHAVGAAQAWLTQHRCAGLLRAVYTTSIDNKPTAVALSVLSFSSDAEAREMQSVVNTPGSGRIVDLVKEGGPWQGGPPPSFDGAAFASTRHGDQLLIAEAAWVGTSSAAIDPALLSVAQRALQLPVT